MRRTNAAQKAALRRYQAAVNVSRRNLTRYVHENPANYGRGDPVHTEMFALMSLWYSTLFVLDEALGRLHVEHQALDEMRQHANHRKLKEFRNATFHWRANADNLLAYVRLEDSVLWAYRFDDVLGALTWKLLKE